MLKLLDRIAIDSHWDRLAILGLRDDLVEEHRRLAVQAIESGLIEEGGEMTVAESHRRVVDWLRAEVVGYGRWERLLSEMESRASLDLAVIIVAVRALGRLSAPVPRAA
jgi:NAD-specific glutamate dehydrogenase